jgi:hypothetical protein
VAEDPARDGEVGPLLAEIRGVGVANGELHDVVGEPFGPEAIEGHGEHRGGVLAASHRGSGAEEHAGDATGADAELQGAGAAERGAISESSEGRASSQSSAETMAS